MEGWPPAANPQSTRRALALGGQGSRRQWSTPWPGARRDPDTGCQRVAERVVAGAVSSWPWATTVWGHRPAHRWGCALRVAPVGAETRPPPEHCGGALAKRRVADDVVLVATAEASRPMPRVLTRLEEAGRGKPGGKEDGGERSSREIKADVRGLKAYTLVERTSRVKINQNESPWDLPEAVKRRVLDQALPRPWSRYPAFDPTELLGRLAAHSRVAPRRHPGGRTAPTSSSKRFCSSRWGQERPS